MTEIALLRGQLAAENNDPSQLQKTCHRCGCYFNVSIVPCYRDCLYALQLRFRLYASAEENLNSSTEEVSKN